MYIEKMQEMARRRGRAFKILIVDDEPWVRDVLDQFCRITNTLEVDMAENGNEAISKITSFDYDLVTMDLVMPEMAGVDAVAKIREIRPHLPVIVITGNATERLINQAGVKGATSLLHKPVALEDFIAELVSTLEKTAVA
ncbi:MAG: response regulator [candidate division Zixibacteria bacterium]|nr:response regulator [candidate division Zixibacteria bacterium]